MGALRLDTRQRGTPERTVLYQVLADHLVTFLDRVARGDLRTLPRFVERELRAFLDCGILARMLALPHRIRFLCAYDPATCAGVRRIFVRAVASFYKRFARDQGIADPRVGCVAFMQRFDSALRINVHFHTLWPDGALACSSAVGDCATFHPTPQITDGDFDKLARAIRQRVLRYLRKHGKLCADAEGLLRLCPCRLHAARPPVVHEPAKRAPEMLR